MDFVAPWTTVINADRFYREAKNAA
jgi:hypothetical protein